MKLTPQDVLEVRKALLAARLAGVSSVVITNGYIAGVHDAHIAAIFSPIKLSLDPAISIGIMKLADFEKRLTLFGDDVLVEGEVNDAKKARKLSIRGKAGKIEYRCTDERMITYPKTNADESDIVVTLSKAEVALLSRGTKTLGGSDLVLQIKRDGSVRMESHDTNQDRFEIEIEGKAVFVDEDAPHPYVNSFDATNSGAFLPLIENMVKENDTAELVVMRTGNISLKVYGHDVFAVPKAQHGDD
jgi:hypothetical protein